MFAKTRQAIYAKIFPCQKKLIAILEQHAEATRQNITARENLEIACQNSIACFNAKMKVQRR